jgi:NADPH-dependent glutamate synthase beta subunit-like oxidoreductase/Pyruvate/2-oxoacid:ferredoxin oxidoreductase delta subunit
MSLVISGRSVVLPSIVRSMGSMSWNHTGAWRNLRPRYQGKVAPCSEACPAGEDIARIEYLVREGALEEAWRRIREENPFPGVCGRVCPHPCESACNRREFDKPVSINSIERHLADFAWNKGFVASPITTPPSGKRVAVVGAGPAGLAASVFLRRLGHVVDLYDAREEAGGMLRYAIPEYRLPRDVLAWEVGLVLSEGVRFHPRRHFGQDLVWEEFSGFDAVFLALGAWTPSALDVDGQEFSRDGLELLEAVRRGRHPRVEGAVAVIGGGDTAIDVARTILRLGANPVIYYRRRREDMPALSAEVHEADEEGIPIRTLLAPERIEAGAEGMLRLVLTPMLSVAAEGGGRARAIPAGAPPEKVDVTAVFTAIGAKPSNSVGNDAVESSRSEAAGFHIRRLVPGEPGAGRPTVFLGGDLVNDERTVTMAIASGKEASIAIDAELKGGDLEEVWSAVRVGRKGSVSMNFLVGGDRSQRRNHVVQFDQLNATYFRYQLREEHRRIAPEIRRVTFDEVKMPVPAAWAGREASRCFHCGLCDRCDNCHVFCPDVSVLKDLGDGSRRIDYDYCKGCGVCVAECPRSAMVLEEEPR